MDRLNMLRAKRGTKTDAMEKLIADRHAEMEEIEQIAELAISEDRAPTPAEIARSKDIEAEIKAADAKIKESEADLKRVDDAIEIEEKLIALKAKNAKPMAGVDAAGAAKVSAAPRRSHYGRRLKAFRERSFGTRADCEDAAYRAGMWCRAVVYGDQKAIQWCAENDVEIKQGYSSGVVEKVQNEGTNTAGGYLVFDELSTAIIDLREEYGVFRQNARVVQMASDVQLIPKRTGGPTAAFAAEGVAFSESDKTWGQVRLQAQALGAITRVSRELADDAVISIADDIASELAYAMAVKEDSVGLNGTGAAADGGITGVRTKFALGSATYIGAIDAASGNDTFAELTAADLNKVIGSIPKYAEAMAAWYGSQQAWALTFLRLVAAAGGTTMGELTGGKPTRAYLGYPYVVDQTMPSVQTDISDTAMLLFGDMSKAITMGERRGVTIDVSRERYFLERQIAIMGWERIDINVHDIGDATNYGPLVALMGE